MLTENNMQKEISLPVLPQSVVHLLHVLNNDDIALLRLAQEIENFPTIAAKLLAVSNSAWAAPVNPITSLHDSCARLGLDVVRSISIALSIAEVFDPSRCLNFDGKKFWYTSLFNAEAAYQYALENQDVDAQSARTTGLLYNIGLLWLAYHKPDETGRAILASRSSYDLSLTMALRNELGTDHHMAGGMLAQVMELPSPLVDAISSSDFDEVLDRPSLSKNIIHSHHLVECLLSTVESCDIKKIKSSEDKGITVNLLNRLEVIEATANVLF